MNNERICEKNQRFDIVLLDADETIFDFQKAEARSFALCLEAHNIEFTQQRLQNYSAINLSLWKALEKGEVTRDKLKTLRFERFFDTIGVSGIDLEKFNDEYVTNLSNSTFMIENAPQFVKKLHRYCKIYLATNGLTKAQTGRFSQSEVKNDIDGMFISEQIGYSKPDKRYYDFIFDKLGVTDKSRVIMLGDSLSSDMLGGKNAGITTCRFSRDGVLANSDLCDYEIVSYDDFFNILFAD